MNILIAMCFVVITCFIWLGIKAHKEGEQNNKVRKSSYILYNASVSERTITSKEVFSTLEHAGIEPKFLQDKTSNL